MCNLMLCITEKDITSVYMISFFLCTVVKIHIKFVLFFFTENLRKHFASIRAIITGPCLIKVFLNFDYYIMLFFVRNHY